MILTIHTCNRTGGKKAKKQKEIIYPNNCVIKVTVPEPVVGGTVEIKNAFKRNGVGFVQYDREAGVAMVRFSSAVATQVVEKFNGTYNFGEITGQLQVVEGARIFTLILIDTVQAKRKRNSGPRYTKTRLQLWNALCRTTTREIWCGMMWLSRS